MMLHRIILTVLLALTSQFSLIYAAEGSARGLANTNGSSSIAGKWLTESGNFIVEISGTDQVFNGLVTKVLSDKIMGSGKQREQKNESESLLGLKILSDFKSTSDGEWKGYIYNRENGKTYDCKIKLAAPDKLTIRAYKFLPLFGKTQLWSRASD